MIESVQATLQHIQLIARKRAKLERAQIEAEQQLVHVVAREFNGGRIGYQELAEIYAGVRGDGERSAAMSGFLTKRWRSALPDIGAVRVALQEREAASRATRVDAWEGRWPCYDRRQLPPVRTCVVYVLFDDELEPCYVGSTGSFGVRMSAHVKDGKRWAHWQAFRCRDREHAYQAEEQFLAEFKPYLNKRRGR